MIRYTQTLGVNTDALACKCRFLLHFISPALSICSRGKGYGERTMKESNERICVEWGGEDKGNFKKRNRRKQVKERPTRREARGERTDKRMKRRVDRISR